MTGAGTIARLDPATGRVAWTRTVPTDAIGAVLASASARTRSGVSYTRLEGIDPRSGRVLWRGPWEGDVYVLGETFTGPPMIIAESCLPSGLVAGQPASGYREAYCDGERLYAINA